MIDVSEIVNDPDFAQSFIINRTSTSFIVGGTSQSTTQIPSYGVIIPDPSDIDQTQEGDRITGSIKIYCTQQLLETSTTGTSDTITWHGQTYRVASVKDWSDNGYFEAKGYRLSGE